MSTRERLSLDFGWKFTLGDISSAKDELFDDSGWRMLDLPHDWSIEGVYEESNTTGSRCGFLPAGIGWYRKTVHVPEEWSGRRIYIEFDGIYMNSDVWINGHHLGNRPYGYMGFEYELTSYLRQGANVIAVRADCSKQPSSRWYNGSGIYRHTWLTVTGQVHVAHWGTYVTTPVIDKSSASVNVRTTVCKLGQDEKLNAEDTKNVTVRSNIFDQRGIKCCTVESELEVQDDTEAEAIHEAIVNDPELWSPDNPVLYKIETQIILNGIILDNYITPFGIRQFAFEPNKGFLLNGIPMKFKGVCNHHDAGPVGAAVPDALLEKRLYMLKEMGCNAIRTAHNPFSPEFYDMCDRIGLMVMNEAFDGWEHTKAPFDYGLYFKEWWQRDLKDLIFRDRNHPCVILWSTGNEVHSMKPETTRMLRDFIHGYDPTRPVTCGVQGTNDNSDNNRAQLDVAGYNDGGGACFVYKRDHERRPEQCFIATESPHTYQTRGFYRTQTWWRDNGDQLDLTPPKADWRKAFYGMGMGLIQSTQEPGDIEVIAVGILGEKVFKEKTQVSIEITSTAIRGVASSCKREIFYTVDGSTPNKGSIFYIHPFEISCSTVVRAAFYEDGVRIAELETRFVQGERPKVIDLAHGNKELNLDHPAGPFAQQVQGEWTDGQYIFEFKLDGEVYRRIGDELIQKIGFWWYDFPVDFLEAQDYAGTGEIWFNSGEKRNMALITQEAKELIIDVSGVFKTAWGDTRQLKLRRR